MNTPMNENPLSDADGQLLDQVDGLLNDNQPAADALLNEMARLHPQPVRGFQQALEDRLFNPIEVNATPQEGLNPMLHVMPNRRPESAWLVLGAALAAILLLGVFIMRPQPHQSNLSVIAQVTSTPTLAPIVTPTLQVPLAAVVMTTREVPWGSGLATLADAFTLVYVPEAQVPADAVRTLAELENQSTAKTLGAFQIVLQADLSDTDFATGIIPTGMIAMEIPLAWVSNDVSSLQTWDVVDLTFSFNFGTTAEPPPEGFPSIVSSTLFENVRIMANGHSLSPTNDQPVISFVLSASQQVIFSQLIQDGQAQFLALTVTLADDSSENTEWNPVLLTDEQNNVITFAPDDPGSCAGVKAGQAGTVWHNPVPEGSFTRAYSATHSGIDLVAPQGTPIHATNSGRVVFAGWNTYGYGNTIVLAHGNFLSLYAHLSQIDVQCGAEVAADDVIGALGATGNTSEPHLHFEIRQGNLPIDPLAILPELAG